MKDGVDSPRLPAGGEGSVHQQHQGHPGQRGQERRDGAAVWQLHGRGSYLAAGGADLPRHPAQHSALQLGQVGVRVGPQWVGGPLATAGGWAAGHSGWAGRWPWWGQFFGPLADGFSLQQVSRPVCKSVEPHRPVPGTGYKACSSATLHLAPVKGS